MDAQQRALAQKCLEGAEGGAMTFPEIVAALTQGGFEGYAVDLRRAVTVYYLPNGEALELPSHRADCAVSEAFDSGALQDAIREAQQLIPGYTYDGFCLKARAAGCAGYMVSFPGRRVLYFGRTAETHTELFPSVS